ncbi:plant virulence effector HPE1-like domain-containing protein [Rhizobium sp. LCM 4573]|uniref:plant virulence effector HPE1-like domain-containing protein n=1 Tax=Rhizobium sp. LCM 4573 TaxID=1848291 RepID=UPI0008DAC3AD|nr:plant virulence effector HPE1-like domain-containing protein [Rhizobium sp. LCM 4573]OHV75894.1 hypothetical protein LCM4573_14605 [Rhizobium sp. LCM 4573]
MRRLILSMALVFAGDTAFASSITPLADTQNGNGSIVMKSCPDCPPPPAKQESTDYRVPRLEPGTQKTAIIEINGERKIARTEAWLGGSPVVHVRKMPEWMESGSHSVAKVNLLDGLSTEAAIATADLPSDGIDLATMTSAVDAQETTEPALLELAGFTLRPRLD